MAEVAIRNIAPIRVDLVLAFIAEAGTALPGASLVGRPDRRTGRWLEGLVEGLDGGWDGLAMVLSRSFRCGQWVVDRCW
jgi:hypothetical protein